MPHSVRYTAAAAAEIANAISWYAQPDIDRANHFVRELERTESHLRSRPELYQRVEGPIRRAVLRRFPYALFYVIENQTVFVLACLHQQQRPRSRDELLGSE